MRRRIYVVSELLQDGTTQVLFACKGDYDYLDRRLQSLLNQYGARDYDHVQEDGHYYFVLYTPYQEVWLRYEETEYYEP